MKISGFSMVKNATKLYYPVAASIQSILPLVDEFVIALGDCDPDDHTRAEIESIGSDKIKIIDTVWDLEKYPRGMENAHQTDIAKNACSGDWLFYLQADEVVHEQDLPVIQRACETLLDDPRIEGLLFKYRHFWGDYNHYHISHGWYPYEIRIVRNDPDIHSWESAQSFRRIPNFDGIHYRQQEGTFKLNVARIDAYIYHYGWVRPPQYMQNKRKALDTIHKGKAKVDQLYQNQQAAFDYGPLGVLATFDGTHPQVMAPWLARFDWADQLNYSKKRNPQQPKHKHETLKYRLLTFLEHRLLGGRQIGGFKNYNCILTLD
ncbi:MAG: hypothetical protein D6675_09150 [Gemmatimonadetes bacterium]|nr:MAG: hypothetical protein D6675_09150 [Gemmatimonadota bacterium]